MDALAESETGRTPGDSPEGSAASTSEGLLSFDAELHVGLVSGGAIALLGLSRSGRQARGLRELLEASPRLDRDAVAKLVAACRAASLPGGEETANLRLPGAPGLHFAIRRASGGSWLLAFLQNRCWAVARAVATR